MSQSRPARLPSCAHSKPRKQLLALLFVDNSRICWGLAMWKIVALSAAALLVAVGSPIGGATAQAPQPPAPTTQPPPAPATQPRAAAPAPAVDKPAKVASPRMRKARHASRHHKRRHTAALRCFGHEWRPFPTRDPKGYFYAPAGGGIC